MIVGWITAFTVGWMVCFGLADLRSTNTLFIPSYTRFDAGLYEFMARPAFAASLGWVALACHKGYGGVIDKFLSWGLFAPLAKMSYMAYLSHMFIIWGYCYSRTYELPTGYWPQVRMTFGTGERKLSTLLFF